MKVSRILYFIAIIFSSFPLLAQEEDDIPFFLIEKPPYYVQTDTLTGETKEIPMKNFLDQWVIKNYRYPQEAVDKKGILSIKEIRGRDPLLEEEACRIFDGFPQLSPALQRGKPVNIFYNYPIVFRISE